jgi:predicted acylesterase/phospholipase RssA
MERNSFGFTTMPRAIANAITVGQGIPAFFEPNLASWWNPDARVGVDHASFYQTTPLRATLDDLVDFGYLNSKQMRMTVGAVNARNGQMRYFDTRTEPLCVEHVMASGALPPAFPAVRIDGEPYWDGGIYSNTPIEAVLDDEPRRHSLIFSVQVWNPDGSEPQSVLDVLDKHKEIQYASRASHAHQNQPVFDSGAIDVVQADSAQPDRPEPAQGFARRHPPVVPLPPAGRARPGLHDAFPERRPGHLSEGLRGLPGRWPAMTPRTGSACRPASTARS